MAAAAELTDQVRDGIEAARDLERLGLKNAVEFCRAEYTKAAMACHHNDDRGRFLYLEAAKQVTLIEQHLIAVAENGKIAASKIAELNPKRGVIQKLRGF